MGEPPGTEKADASALEPPDARIAPPPRPDAMPPDAAPPDACVPTQVQLLVNPAFDNGTTGWTEAGQPGEIIRHWSQMISVPEQTAPNDALMGSAFNIADEKLSQDVAIPAGTTALTLAGYRIVATNETSTSTAYDKMSINVVIGGTATVLGSLTNLDGQSSAAWRQFSYPIAPVPAGQTVTIQFEASTDDSNNTNFFLDSLQLNATVCQ